MSGTGCALGEEQHARAGLYGLLARLLGAAPDAALLEEIGALPGDKTPIGSAFQELANAAQAISAETAEEEYDALFIGVAEGELVPFASYYLTGFLHEKPLAALRDDLRRLGVERVEQVKEPEDHIAFLLEVMGGLITGALGEPADGQQEQTFFERHIAPWAGDFFADLQKAESANLYRAVGKLGARFVDVETTGFRIAA